MDYHRILSRKIRSKNAIVGIIGLGYVGLPLALNFSNSGYKVIGFDTDINKIKKLSKGKSYISYIKNAQITSQLNNRRFEPTDDYNNLSLTDAILICVPTPLDENRQPDLTFIIETSDMITKYLKKGHLIVLESTTYPGTTEEVLVPELISSNLKLGRDFFVGYSPEREDPGNKKFKSREIPKIVSGITDKCLRLTDLLYQNVFSTTVMVSSTRVAEASKLLENIYRAVNIALVNELKLVFGKMNIDIWEVIDAASTKPFGFTPFYPGPGLGGHCIPIDPFYLSWKAKSTETPTKFIELAGEINTNMPIKIVKTIVQALNEREKSVKGSKILLLGLAYKKDVDDTRESPTLKIMALLKEMGAKIDYNDPFIPQLNGVRNYPDLNIKSVALNDGTLSKYDCIVIVTDHSSYNWKSIVEKSKLVIDTRNATRKLINKNNIIKA